MQGLQCSSNLLGKVPGHGWHWLESALPWAVYVQPPEQLESGQALAFIISKVASLAGKPGCLDWQTDKMTDGLEPTSLCTLARHGHVHSWISKDCSVDSGEAAACDAAAYTDTLVDALHKVVRGHNDATSCLFAQPGRQ